MTAIHFATNLNIALAFFRTGAHRINYFLPFSLFLYPSSTSSSFSTSIFFLHKFRTVQEEKKNATRKKRKCVRKTIFTGTRTHLYGSYGMQAGAFIALLRRKFLRFPFHFHLYYFICSKRKKNNNNNSNKIINGPVSVAGDSWSDTISRTFALHMK